MYSRETRVLLRHYLEQGVGKAELARRFGVSRRTVYNWIESGQLEPALAIIEGMQLFAPDHAGLWREAGLINAELGNLRAAIAALERCVALAGEEGARHHAAALLQQLRSRLQ